MPITELVDTSYHHAASESPTFGHSHDPEKAALGGGIHCAEGELRIKQGPGMEFVAKKGDVWSCNKGLPEDTENIGTGVSIMRVIDFDLA